LGQYTDDSQLARELLQSYITCGKFDPQDYANRVAAIFAEGRIVGYGQATVAAARGLLGNDLYGDLCGGDVDTMAAMASAISGAYLGLEAIPVELSCRLTDHRVLGITVNWWI
jgi:ADP-ribosylglycohydrolase